MRKAAFLLVTLLLITIAGCGGSGGTSSGLGLFGTLTMDAKLENVAPNKYQAVVTSVYTHPTKDATGVPLTFWINAQSASGSFSYNFAEEIKQPAGGWTITWPVFTQINEDVVIEVGVTAGDLKQFKRLVMPALAPIAANPIFVNMSTGLTQSVTLSGSLVPYSIVSQPAGVSANIINTYTLTISEAAFQKLNGTIRVTSSLGEFIDIDLRY